VTTSPGSPDPPDVGLAAERTVLAWNRSGLAVVVCVAVLLRHVWPLQGTDHEVALGLIGAAVIVWSVIFAVLTLPRGERGPHVSHAESVFGLITAGTLLLAVVAVVASFAAP
jgi:uncharacterized membrane protein YidH (DUF202 family)